MIELSQSLLDELWGFVPPQQQKSLNRDAFNDIARVYIDFINAHEAGEPKSTHWVCDAAPGHGKTTVLACLLAKNAIARASTKTPAILVFNNKDTMQDFVAQLHELYIAKVDQDFRDPDLIQYVDSENVTDVEGTLSRYRYICVTQQRLRDLAVDYGNWAMYRSYTPDMGVSQSIFHKLQAPHARMIIVDEMPIFFDECIFDIGTDNNSVAWFDTLAKASKLPVAEKALGRSFIMLLIATHLVTNKEIKTTALKAHLSDDSIWGKFTSIMSSLNTQGKPIDWDTAKYKRWFERLLNEDAVGRIDTDDNGQAILCSQKIDYTRLGNVLILDGTMQITPSFYTDYVPKHVENRHDYQNRIYLHWRKINTSAGSRSKDNKGVQGAVGTDLVSIREGGVRVFPLVAKADISEYMKNGVITDEQQSLYTTKAESTKGSPRDVVKERLALNLFNTTGKNDLRGYSALGMTNLPIRHPQYYKLKAIGLYGTEIDISMAESVDHGWFKSSKVESLYHELFLADFSQIIHRTSLRNIESADPVDIYLYHSIESWNRSIVKTFGLTTSHTTEEELFNEELYDFRGKCEYYAQECVKYAESRNNPFGSAVEFRPSAVDRKFKQWFNRNMKEPDKGDVIRRIFAQQGLGILIANERTREKHIQFMRQ